jgi:hypothetical protein
MEEQASSFSFGSALSGFFVALLIIWIGEILRDVFEKRNLVASLKFELDHNLFLYGKFRETIEEQKKKIFTPNGAHPTDIDRPDYSLCAGHFTTKFYESGLLALYLTPDELSNWNLAVKLEKCDREIRNAHDNWWKKSCGEELDVIATAEGCTRNLRRKLNQPLIWKLSCRFFRNLRSFFH